MPVSPKLLQTPTQQTQATASKENSSTAPKNFTASDSQSTSIDLPDGPRPKVSRLTDTDDTPILMDRPALVKQASLSKSKKIHHLERERKNSIEERDFVTNNSHAARTKVQNPKREGNHSIEERDLASNNSHAARTKVQMIQRIPESFPVTKPNGLLQGTRMTRLQQAPKNQTYGYFIDH